VNEEAVGARLDVRRGSIVRVVDPVSGDQGFDPRDEKEVGRLLGALGRANPPRLLVSRNELALGLAAVEAVAFRKGVVFDADRSDPRALVLPNRSDRFERLRKPLSQSPITGREVAASIRTAAESASVNVIRLRSGKP